MAAADAMLASAALVLGASGDKTRLLPHVIDALYTEFGKDECKAVMQGGAKQWFEQYPLEFRVNTHVQGGKDPWHSVTLIGSGWQAVGSTSTACSGEQERPVDIQTFKKQVVELLARSGEIPLGQLTNKHQKAYGHKTQFKPPSTGLRALLLSEAFSSDVDVVPWAESPNPGEFVARLITPSSRADPEVLCFVYALNLLFSKSQRWPSTKQALRIEAGLAGPLCSGMGAKLYKLSLLGCVKVLSGTVVLVWNLEKIRLLVLSTPPAIRQEAEILVLCTKMSAGDVRPSTSNEQTDFDHNNATADDYLPDEANIEHGFVEISNEPLHGAAFSVDCGPLHVEATPTALPEPGAEPPSQQSTDPTTRLLEAMLSNVDAEQPDREADVVTRGIALGMLRARTGMIRLETRAEAGEARAEAAEARVATLEAELHQASRMLSNALEAQMHLEARLLQMASSSTVVQGEPMSAAEAQVVELEGLQ